MLGRAACTGVGASAGSWCWVIELMLGASAAVPGAAMLQRW